MKKYTKPMIEIVELQSNVNIADVNPIAATSTTNVEGTITTIYNLAALAPDSGPQAN